MERLAAISRTFAPARDLEIQGAGRSVVSGASRSAPARFEHLGVDTSGRADFDEPSAYFFVVPALSALA